MAFEPGTVFAGYTIRKLVGSGGMGQVYLAQHPRLQRQVALKVVNSALSADPKARARFEREVEVVTRLEHPNIVAIHDRSGPGDPVLWLAMRYVSGGDTAELIARADGRLPADRALHLITGAARGLGFAHRQGVLHRDVKPANLLIEQIDDLEQVLVADFGIARSLDDTATRSTVMASLAYAAPERFEGVPVDLRADVYSLGATFYEMLTGQTPFPRSDQAAVFAAHLTAPPPRPTALRPDLPGGLDEVIATAMAKSPGHRFSDCMEFATETERALTSSDRATMVNPRHLVPKPPASAPPKSPAAEPAESGSPVRAIVFIAVSLLILLALVIALIRGVSSAGHRQSMEPTTAAGAAIAMPIKIAPVQGFTSAVDF
ncbi:serine/threonine-protein kinase [Nocardia sp. NPDC056000]|uniref:serine/threonine-protein kinase n=1 Tax=Nocardia sp. NPDC056000 TaxID=3345674 RepID=UPI0035D5F57F